MNLISSLPSPVSQGELICDPETHRKEEAMMNYLVSFLFPFFSYPSHTLKLGVCSFSLVKGKNGLE
jgi:hypothetical protein